MKDPKTMIFFNADQGGESGSETNFAEATGGVFDAPETTDAEATTTDKETVTPEVKPTPSLTPEQITAAVREGVRPEEKAREYTPEELDQIFKVWKPGDEIVTKLLAGGKDAVDALVLMREGLAGQFGQLVKYELEVLKKQLTAEYGPSVQWATEARQERDREAFFKANEDLRDHEKLVDIAYKSLLGEGKKFPSLAEANKALADRAKTLIPNGNGSGTVPTNGARQTTTTTKAKPAALSVGGQSGGSGGGSATPNVFHEIFGARG